MADRVKPMGMDRALISKMGAKYDSGLEYEVRGWIKQLIGEDIGEGPSNVEKKFEGRCNSLQFDEEGNRWNPI